MIGSIGQSPAIASDFSQRGEGAKRVERLPADASLPDEARRSLDGRAEVASEAPEGERGGRRDRAQDPRAADPDARTAAERQEAARAAGDEPDRGSTAERDEALRTRQDRAEIDRLRRLDARIRLREQVQRAASGELAKGSVHYDYEVGPDGHLYAVAARRSIDASPVRGDPERTIRKMERVRRASIGSGEATPRDRALAAQANFELARARAELARTRAAQERAGRLFDLEA